MSGGVPVSISLYPDNVTRGSATSIIVTVPVAPTSQPESVTLQYVQLSNDGKEDLLLSSPGAIAVPQSSLAKNEIIVTNGSSSGGRVVVIAGTSSGVKTATLTIN